MLPAAKEETFLPSAIECLLGTHVEGETETLSETRVWGFGEKIQPLHRGNDGVKSKHTLGCENSSWKNVSGSALDANGNTLSDAQGRSFTWDFENRLTQAVVPGTNGGTTTFRYDPFGRRIQKSGPLGTTNYLYDGMNPLTRSR
jgi:YD repeat-containing protein